jgi:urease accessory protein
MNMRARHVAALVGAAFGVAIGAQPVAAHTGHVMHGLDGGLTHPLLGPDHLLAMVTVGILAVTLDRAVVVPATFVAAMVFGGALGMNGVPLPLGEMAISLSVLALGGALIAGRTMRPQLALALVAIAGIAHGHAHGAEAPHAAHPVAYVAGFVLATAALHATGIGIGVTLRRRPVLRATIGTLVAAAGVGLVATTSAV